MNRIYSSIINELEKVFCKRKNMVLLILTVLITAGTALLLSSLHQGLGIYAVRPVDFPIYILGLFTKIFLPLFIFMWSSDLFAGELAEHSLKIALLRPVSRLKVYLSKNIAIAIAILLLLGTLFLTSILSSLIMGASGQGFGTGLLEAIKAYLLAFIPMLSLSVAASFVAQFFRSSSGAMTSLLLLYVLSMLLPIVVPQASVLLLTSYTGWHILWLGSSILPSKLLHAFLIMLSTSMIFFAAGFYFFDTKEL